MNDHDYVTFDPKIPKHKPIITKLLILLISAMFVVEMFYMLKYGEKGIIMLGAKWNEGITHGEYWRFFTCALLHGGFMHLFLNLAGLYIFGRELESIYGPIKFLLICLLTSWGSTLTSYTFSSGTAIGASGIVFGIIGSLIAFYFMQKGKVTGADYKFKSMYTLVIINLVLGFMMPQIDNSAHIGGIVTGLLSGWLLSPKYEIKKDDENQKLKVIEEKNISRFFIGVILLILMFIWLTKLAILSK